VLQREVGLGDADVVEWALSPGDTLELERRVEGLDVAAEIAQQLMFPEESIVGGAVERDELEETRESAGVVVPIGASLELGEERIATSGHQVLLSS
jgi:hypothetical protein